MTSREPLRLGSLFAGIGGFDLGFEQAGFQTIWEVEKDEFCQSVLRTRFPEAELHGDVREVGAHNLRRVDVVTGGVPCQDWSIAGKRAGIAGARSGLFFEFARILGELRPPYFVFENVPGLLSAGAGRDFGVVLSTLAALGYGLAWRCMDSRFFGVAQRRRRVFVVGSLGNMLATEILLESKSRAGHLAPGRKAGTDVAYALAASVRGTGDGHGNAWNTSYVARSLANSGVSSGYRYDPNGEEYVVSATLRKSDGHHGRSSPRGDGGDNLVASPLKSSDDHRISAEGAFNLVTALRHLGRGGPDDNEAQGGHIVIQDVRGRTRAGSGYPAVACAQIDANRVRDTSGVSEGLDDSQFPLLPRGLDSARYRALENAVTVSVAAWLGRRIRGVIESVRKTDEGRGPGAEHLRHPSTGGIIVV